VNDLWMVAATLGFFALCVAYVKLCDRIIGPDDVESADLESADVASTDVASAEIDLDRGALR